MPKLYEITSEYEKLMDTIFENDGVIDEHLGASLDVVKDEFNEKVLNVAKMIKNLEGEQAAFDNESQRLMGKARTIQNNISWLKDYIKNGMRRLKTNEVKGEILTIRIRPSPPSCLILNDKLVPSEFIRIIPETKEVNKKAVIQHYKDRAEIVPGTEISVGTTLTIK